MKLELSIADDTELRNAIRDAIKGEVTSIVRAELREIIKEVVGKSKNLSTAEKIEAMAREEVKNYVSKSFSGGFSTIRDMAKKEIAEQVGTVIAQLIAKEKFLDFLKDQKVIE